MAWWNPTDKDSVWRNNPVGEDGILRLGGANNPLNWSASDWNAGMDRASNNVITRNTGIDDLWRTAKESYRGAYEGNTDWLKVLKGLGTGVGEFGISVAPIARSAGSMARGAMLTRGTEPLGWTITKGPLAGRTIGKSVLGRWATGTPRQQVMSTFLQGLQAPLGGFIGKGTRNLVAKGAVAGPGAFVQRAAGLAGAGLGGLLLRSDLLNLSKRFGDSNKSSSGGRAVAGNSPEARAWREGYGQLVNASKTGNYGLGVPAPTWQEKRSAVTTSGMGSGRNGVTNDQVVTTGKNNGGGGGGGGGSTGGSGTTPSPDTGTKLALSPEEQAMLDQARTSALEQYNMGRAEIDRARRGGSLRTQQALREAGRLGATSAADLQAAAAEMGFGSSPAAYGAGLSDIAAEEARRRMAAQADYRGLQEQLRVQGATNQSAYERYLRELQAQETMLRAARGVSNVQGRYGV